MRWKVKGYRSDGYDFAAHHGVKVCLQFRKFRLFWLTAYRQPCRTSIAGSPVSMVESVEQTAKLLLEDATKDAKKLIAKRRIKGVYRTGNY